MKIKVKLSDKTKEELRGLPGHTPTGAELISLITPLIPPAVSGHTPTPKELLALIKPFIPKDGETPSDARLLKLIKPLIPKPKIGIPGKTPTKKELKELIQPLIPDPIPGEDGSPDTGEQIKDKINFDYSGKKIAPIHLDLPQITELIGGLTKLKADGLYVNLTGDTMTGGLTISAGSTSEFILQTGVSTNYKQTFRNIEGTSLNWLWGNGTTEDLYMSMSLAGGQNRWDNKGRNLLFRSTAQNPIMLLNATTGD